MNQRQTCVFNDPQMGCRRPRQQPCMCRPEPEPKPLQNPDDPQLKLARGIGGLLETAKAELDLLVLKEPTGLARTAMTTANMDLQRALQGIRRVVDLL